MIRFSFTFFYFLLAVFLLCTTYASHQDVKILEQLQEHISKIESENLIFKHKSQIQIQQTCSNITNLTDSHSYKKVQYTNLAISKQTINHCEIKMLGKGSHFLFQTPRNSYIGVNNAMEGHFGIFNSDCQLIAKIQNITVVQMVCDRGLCDDGNVFILTNTKLLIGCSESKNFTHCSTIAQLSHGLRGELVGLIIRNKGNGDLQLYVADSEGQIIAYDVQGNRRLSIPVEKNSKIVSFTDIHPHPIIVTTRGWIYTFDYTKYIIMLTKCPYLFHQITSTFVAHPYSSYLYLISSNVATKMEIKSQPKSCEISSKFYFNHKVEQLQLNSMKNIKYKEIAEYQGQLYIGNKIITMKEKKITQLNQCKAKAVFNFQLMKNNYRKGYYTLQCCETIENEINCGIVIFKNKNLDQQSSKNNTVIMIVILLMVILLVFFFLRNSTPNLDYDQQLKFKHNLRYKNQVQQYLRSNSQSKQMNESKLKRTQKSNQQQFQRSHNLNQNQNNYKMKQKD